MPPTLVMFDNVSNLWLPYTFPALFKISVANVSLFRMSLAEALSAATINAAHSLGRGATHGSIEVGKVPQGNIFFVHKFSLENVFFCPNF